MQKLNSKSVFALRLCVALAMLSAISIICGKYLAINLGEVLRISFENLPIIFAGIALGPACGALVGVVADLVGCVLVGYAINPIVTLGAAIIGTVSGAVFLLLKRIKALPLGLKVTFSVAVSHIFGSVIVKTFGLAVFYDMPVFILMLWRLLNYTVIAIPESILLWVLMRNSAIQKSLRSISHPLKSKSFVAFANSFQAVTVPGLERISALCQRLGNPQDKLKFIHIAGTNGKGSVCANLACILEDAGFKTGKYISPNLVRVNERISINGECISDSDIESILTEIEPLAKDVERDLGIAPTQFEIWTAAAFVYFERQGCDYVVLEVGLGGEFDATNLIKSNEITVITRLGLDHTQYLGNTISEIARAKAGILKKACASGYTVTVEQEPEAFAAIKERADSLGIKLALSTPEPKGADGICERFSTKDLDNILCGIPGYHQIENASLAATAAAILGIGKEYIYSGIARAKNPARFELINTFPPVIYDGGHNENGIEALVKSLKRYYDTDSKTVVFACMADKDIEPSLKMLNYGNTEFVFTEVKNNPRAMNASDLKEKALEYGISGTALADIGDAYEYALSRGVLTVICGSLYLYKDLQEYFEKKKGE